MFFQSSNKTRKRVRRLIEAELESLWRFSLHISHDVNSAEELVQRTCLRALEQSAKYTEMQSPRSWLFRIAQNIWKNELRAASVRQRHCIWGQTQSNLYAPEQNADNQTPERLLELRQVLEAVDKLPEAQRWVMILVAIEGFSYSETASVLEVPIGTVMSRLSRARLVIGEQFAARSIDSFAKEHNVAANNKRTKSPRRSSEPTVMLKPV